MKHNECMIKNARCRQANVGKEGAISTAIECKRNTAWAHLSEREFASRLECCEVILSGEVFVHERHASEGEDEARRLAQTAASEVREHSRG